MNADLQQSIYDLSLTTRSCIVSLTILLNNLNGLVTELRDIARQDAAAATAAAEKRRR